MTHKLTSTNSYRDAEPCARCGRRQRSGKLERTAIGWCCRRCAAVIADVYGEQDATL